MIRTARLLRQLFGGRNRWALVVILTIVVTGAEAVGAYLVYALVDALSSGSIEVPVLGRIASDDGSMPRFAILAGLFFAARAGLAVVLELVLNRRCFGAGADLERRLLRGYLLMPVDAQRRRGHAELVRTVHDSVVMVVQGGLIPMLTAAALWLKVGAIVIVMLVASPGPTLAAALVLGPLLVLMGKLIRPVVHRYGKQVEDSLARSLGVATETLRLAPEVRLGGRVEHFSGRFGSVRDHLATVMAAEETLRKVPRILGETILILFVAGYLAVAALSGDAASTLPTVGLFAYAGLRVLPSLISVVGLVHAIHYTRPALENVVADAHLLIDEPVTDRSGAGTPASTIELRDVTLHHEGALRPALDAIDLTLQPGDVVALIGSNGAGKSTLAELLTGLIDPTSGTILVDGTPLADRRDAWLSTVGLVAQQVHLLDDDVATNVALTGDPADRDEHAVDAAIDRAGLADVVAGLPHGTRSVLGEDGGQLSGGERQRMALARGLYREASVLVIDEGTSALDAASSANLADAVTESHPGRLTILVTHDRELARRCTRVIHLEQGRIVADGPPHEVLPTVGAEVASSAARP